MPNFNTFWGGRGEAYTLWDDPSRAVDIATMINDHPTTVTLKRGVTTLAAQTVLATRPGQGTPTNTAGESGVAGSDRLLLIGVQNHPTLADFNVQRGDSFRLFGTNYKVAYVISNNSQVVEAYCEGQQ
jgi:hypothetical protein